MISNSGPSFDQREIEEAFETGALKVQDRKLFEEFLRIQEHFNTFV